jgi:hypothetical protein
LHGVENVEAQFDQIGDEVEDSAATVIVDFFSGDPHSSV